MPTFTDDTPTASTYTQVATTGADQYLYRDASSSLDEPRTARLSHTIAKSANGVNRHLLQMSRTNETDDGVSYTGSVHVVIAMPKAGVAAADMLLEWEKLRNMVDDDWSLIIAGLPLSES
jgi:hypothetical protein